MKNINDEIMILENKILELKKEQLFKDIFNNCLLRIDDDVINFYKNGIWYCMKDIVTSQYIFSYNVFWNEFYNQFNMPYYEIELFLQKMVDKYLSDIAYTVDNSNASLIEKLLTFKNMQK
jgi:hypothetical protein